MFPILNYFPIPVKHFGLAIIVPIARLQKSLLRQPWKKKGTVKNLLKLNIYMLHAKMILSVSRATYKALEKQALV